MLEHLRNTTATQDLAHVEVFVELRTALLGIALIGQDPAINAMGAARVLYFPNVIDD